MANKTITHYGVPGMKWGVRKASSSSTADKAKAMSSADLKAAVKRMELEKRYVDLASPPSQKAKNVVQDILINEAKQQGRILLNKGIGIAVKKALG